MNSSDPSADSAGGGIRTRKPFRAMVFETIMFSGFHHPGMAASLNAPDTSAHDRPTAPFCLQEGPPSGLNCKQNLNTPSRPPALAFIV